MTPTKSIFIVAVILSSIAGPTLASAAAWPITYPTAQRWRVRAVDGIFRDTFRARGGNGFTANGVQVMGQFFSTAGTILTNPDVLHALSGLPRTTGNQARTVSQTTKEAVAAVESKNEVLIANLDTLLGSLGVEKVKRISAAPAVVAAAIPPDGSPVPGVANIDLDIRAKRIKTKSNDDQIQLQRTHLLQYVMNAQAVAQNAAAKSKFAAADNTRADALSKIDLSKIGIFSGVTAATDSSLTTADQFVGQVKLIQEEATSLKAQIDASLALLEDLLKEAPPTDKNFDLKKAWIGYKNDLDTISAAVK